MVKSNSRPSNHGPHNKNRFSKSNNLKSKVKKKHGTKINTKFLKQNYKKGKNENTDNNTQSDPVRKNEKFQQYQSGIVPDNMTKRTEQKLLEPKEHHRKPVMKHKKEKQMKRKKEKGVLVKTDTTNINENTDHKPEFAPKKDKSSLWKTNVQTLNKDGWREKKKYDSQHIKTYNKYETSNNSENRSKRVNNSSLSKRPDIWFDDVDMDLIDCTEGKVKPAAKVTKKSNPLVKEQSFDGLTRTVAMDCEMVGVGADSKDSILARVSIVNLYGKCIYDKFVKPTEKVTDYRTEVSGIRRKDIVKGEDFKVVQKEVSDIMHNRTLVGHALKNDLQVLFLDHPHKMIRDTMRYRPFRAHFNGRNPSLKKLASQVLGVEVQQGEHNSVQDAQAAMRLYTMHKIKWEAELATKFRKPNPGKWKKPKKSVQRNQFVMDLDDSD